MAEIDIFSVQKPWNLEADIDSLVKAPEPLPGLKVNTAAEQQGVATPSVPVVDVNAIARNVVQKVNSKKDPFENKYQKAELSNRYAGKGVNFGDWQLDPKLLDARYSKTQSYGEQAFNSLKVGLANGGAMFAIGMLGLPDLLDNIKSGVTGEAVEQSALINNIYDWRKGVEENNVTFENEQDQKTDAWNTIKNVLLPSAISGSSKGWGGIFENVMYGVGAGAAIAAQEALVSFIAPGVGNSAVLGTSVARLINNVNSIRKYSKLADRILDTSQTITTIGNALNTSNKIKNAARWAYGSTIGANGESAFEGIEGERNLLDTQIQEYTQKNGTAPTGKDLENIKTIARQAGSARYWLNMGVLMGTNAYQLKRLFRNMDLAKDSAETLAKQGLKVTLNAEGKPVASKLFELKSDWWNRGFQKNLKGTVEAVGGKLNTDFAKESLSEGLEEYTQGWIDKSVNSYYEWKLDHRGQPSIDQALKSIGSGFSDSWNTEGLKSFLSGAIAGVAQQAAYSIPNAKGQIELSRKRKEELQKTLDSYAGFDPQVFLKSLNVNSVRGTLTNKAQNLNALGVADEVAEGALDNNDKKIYKDMETLSFFINAEPYVSKGHADILKQQFELSMDGIKTDEEFAELVGNPNMTKAAAIQEFNTKVDEVNASFSAIKQAFKNPYRYNGDATEQARYNIFEEHFIPQLAYLDHRTKQLNRRAKDIQSTLGPYYDDFKYFSDLSTLKNGRTHIAQKLKRLEDSKDFHEDMSKESVLERDYFNKDKYLTSVYTDALDQLDRFIASDKKSETDYKNFLDTYHEGFVSEHDRDNTGFFNKEDVLQKLSDHERIVNDLNSVQKMLKSYLAPNGEELFVQSFAALSEREARKREFFEVSQEYKDLGPKIAEEYPDLSSEEIQEILKSASSADDILKRAEEFHQEKLKRTEAIEATKSKVRDKFIQAGKGDLVEAFIDNEKITSDNEKEVLASADSYLKYLSDKEFSDFKAGKHKIFMDAIKALNDTFDNTGMLPENQDAYDTLTKENKIKYHEALIDFHSAVASYKGVPAAYLKKEKDAIEAQKEAIKELKKEPKVPYMELVGDYVITEDITTGKFNLSFNGKYVSSYDSVKAAKDKIKKDQQAAAKKKDVKAEEDIYNFENKFENDYFDPETYDENGNQLIDKEGRLDNKAQKAELYSLVSPNKSNDDINNILTDNIAFERYTTDGRDGTIELKDSGDPDSGQLLTEPILRSMTADSVVASYNGPLGKFPLNTFKSPKDAVGFVSADKMREIFSKLLRINPTSITSDEIIDFIGSGNYYNFLIKSTFDQSIFDLLVGKGIIGFKGTPQQQIDLINERQQVFDRLMNDSVENIKRDFQFQREYRGIQYSNIGTRDIGTVVYPFSLLKEKGGDVAYNQYVFFRVKENFGSVTGTPDVEFVDLAESFHEDALSKIKHSFVSKFKDDVEQFAGYYMMTTDESGSPATYKLKAKDISSEEFLEMLPLNQATIIPNIEDLTFSYSAEKQRFNISDLKDGTVLYVKAPVSTIEDVNQLKKTLLYNLGTTQTWFDKDNTGKQKNFGVKGLTLTFSKKTESGTQPTSVADILSTRNVVGIARTNYMVSKVVPKLRDKPFVAAPVKKAAKPTAPKTPPVISPNPAVSSAGAKGIIDGFNFKFPDFINTSEIDIFVNGIKDEMTSTPDQITTAIVQGINKKLISGTNRFYLNSDGINLKVLDGIAKQTVPVISNSFGQKAFNDALNLFTDRMPYKTDNPTQPEIEDRVRELIKNCIRK